MKLSKSIIFLSLAAGVAHGILNAGHEAVDLTAGILGDEENKDAELENVPAVINDQENGKYLTRKYKFYN